MKSFPATGVVLLPARLDGIVGGEEEQQFRLQWIGILKLVDEDPPETTLEMTADLVVVLDEIARPHQQVEEIERAFSRLQRLVHVDARHQLLLQQCRQIRIGAELKFLERLDQPIARVQHLRARHAFGIGRSAALSCALDIAVPAQLDEERFQFVEIFIALRCLSTSQIAAQPPDRLGIDVQVVTGVGR
jgi:hypothetical protein